jgi:hypothetical protein
MAHATRHDSSLATLPRNDSVARFQYPDTPWILAYSAAGHSDTIHHCIYYYRQRGPDLERPPVFSGSFRMPFFIFKIDTDNRLEYIGEEEKYRPARERVRTLRAGLEPGDGSTYRMVFANSVGQGETLLSVTERDDKIIGDD